MGWTPNHRHDDRDRPASFGRSSGSRYDNDDWRDERREGGARELQRDNGWGSRKPSAPTPSWDEPPSKGWASGRGDSSHREDRSWEPSASWQPGRRDGASSASFQRSQNGGKQKGKQKGSKKGGKQQSQPQQQKRNWREDDSQLNKCVAYTCVLTRAWVFIYSLAGHVVSPALPRKAPH